MLSCPFEFGQLCSCRLPDEAIIRQTWQQSCFNFMKLLVDRPMFGVEILFGEVRNHGVIEIETCLVDHPEIGDQSILLFFYRQGLAWFFKINDWHGNLFNVYGSNFPLSMANHDDPNQFLLWRSSIIGPLGTLILPDDIKQLLKATNHEHRKWYSS